MNKIKKILPIILAFVLVFGSCLTVSASSSEPYYNRNLTEGEIAALNECIAYLQEQNIDISAYDNLLFIVKSSGSMALVGADNYDFKGIYDSGNSENFGSYYSRVWGDCFKVSYINKSPTLNFNNSNISIDNWISGGFKAYEIYASNTDIYYTDGTYLLKSNVSVFPHPITPDTNNTYSNNETEGSILVTAEVGSTYTISLPATLALSYNQTTGMHEGEYTVGVQANLTGNEAITVAPNSTVFLTNEDSVVVEGTVTQDKNTWKLTTAAENELVSDYTRFVETTGKISANIPRSGSYSGTLNFTFTKTQ